IGLVALDEVLSIGGERGEATTLGDTIADRSQSPVAAFEVEEMKQILAMAINRLGEREKIVLTLYYYEGLTLAEIGEVRGVTERPHCHHLGHVAEARSHQHLQRHRHGRGGSPGPRGTPERGRQRPSGRRDHLAVAPGHLTSAHLHPACPAAPGWEHPWGTPA